MLIYFFPFPPRHFGLPVWTTSAPNDGGLSVGGVWAAAPPRRNEWTPLQFMGMWPVDKAWVPVAAEAFSATRPTIDGEGHQEKKRGKEREGGERERKKEREWDTRNTETKNK